MTLLFFVILAFAVIPAAIFFLVTGSAERKARMSAIRAGMDHFGSVIGLAIIAGVILLLALAC